MKRNASRTLSLVLIIAMVLQLFPTVIFATEDVQGVENDAGFLQEEAPYKGSTSSESVAQNILFEVEELRTETVKHFRMDDGSYIAVQYGTPVHYEANGKWVDYDNTLREVSAFGEDGISHYTVTNGDSTRIFAADANAETLLIVQKGDYSLSLTPVEEPDAEIPIVPVNPETASVMGTMTEAASPATVLSVASDGGEDFADPVLADAQPDKIYSALEYADAINGAAIRYENYANTIKESIIITAPQVEYVYSFRMATEGLTPSLQEDGSVLLISPEGEVPYRIPAPYMFDSNYETSYDAFYTLTSVGDEWIFTVTADAAWLNAEERAFPVYLDPTVEEIAGSEGAICGNFVRSGYPDGPDPTTEDLYVGHAGNENGLTRTYLHVNDLVELPAGCELYEATISLYHAAHAYRTAGADIEIGAYAITKAGSLDGNASPDAWRAWADNLSWTKTTNGTTAADGIILDKQTLGSHTLYQYVSWDITTLAYDWYDSENHYKNLGIALRVVTDADASTVGSRAAFRGAGNANYSYGKPCMKISYRNTRGIEDRYTYQTLNIGRAGTSYISDYTLDNTHIVPLFSSPSNVMPFSVSLVYNTSLTARYFSQGYNGVNTQNYNNMLVGVGWKLSLQQSVVPVTVDGVTYLVYADADGTEHYFHKNGNSYQDEDGLSLTITQSGTTYTMTNPYGDTWIFVNGYLTEQTDAYGNALYYCYNSNAYNSESTAWKPISDSANKVTAVYRKNIGASAPEQLLKIEYDGYFVSKVIGECDYSSSSAAKRTVTLDQSPWSTDPNSCAMLTSVNFPDGAVMQYTYYGPDAAYNYHQRIKTIYDSEANYGVQFGYSYASNVSSFFEYIVDKTNVNEDSEDNENLPVIYGAKYHGYKRAHSQTAYRYYGKDGKPYMDEDGKIENATSTDDLVTVKVLDHYGRTVGSYTSNWNETEILGAGAASYTQNSGTSRTNNRITASASAGQQGINLLKNSSAENDASGWINANASPSDHFIGNKSFKTTNTTFYQAVDLTSGEDYTFSAYVKVPEGTTFSDSGSVKLSFLNSSGEEQASSETLNYSTSTTQGGWMRLTVTYTAENTDSYRVAVVPEGVTGSIFVDALQLEKGKAASTYNIVENGSFEFYSTMPPAEDSALFGWFSAAAPTLNPSAGEKVPFGSRRVSMLGTDDVVRLNQHVQLALPGDTDFILSGWAKANAKPDSAADTTDTSKPYFGLIIRLYYSDGNSEPYFFPFDAYYDDWQYMQCVVASKKSADVTITDAYVVAAYDNNINGACFDNISLRMEPVQTYDYDTNGNVIAATQSGAGRNDAEYAENGVDLLQYTATNGTAYSFTYNDQHDVLSQSSDGVTTSYEYSTAGNVTQSTVQGVTASGQTIHMETSAEYTESGNHTSKVTDAAQNETNYLYDEERELLTKLTDAKGGVVEYSYNEYNDRPTATTYKDASGNVLGTVSYTYTNGLLSSLNRSFTRNTTCMSQSYSFTYNAWGQTTSTKVGSLTLASYTYADMAGAPAGSGGGNRTQMTYGNGNSVSYEYDEFDRMVKMLYNDTGKYIAYCYNAEGSLAEYSYRNSNGSVISRYVFEYDSLGRLIRSVEYDGNGNLVQRTEQLYDSIGRLSSQTWVIGEDSYSEAYTYNDPTETDTSGDGSLASVTTATGDTVNYGYDALKRVVRETVKNGEDTRFYTAYAYKDVVYETQTTGQVEYRNVRDADGTLIDGYKYTYDALGNITGIYESEIAEGQTERRPLALYEYDAQSQLTKETLYTYATDSNGIIRMNTEEWNYTYDSAGNLVGKQPVVKGITGTAKNYSYENEQWKDLLTAYDGEYILYEGQSLVKQEEPLTGVVTVRVSGEPISGNPIHYYNGMHYDMEWEQGRDLAESSFEVQDHSASNQLQWVDKENTIGYSYDADGIRTSKAVVVDTYRYRTSSGSSIVSITPGNEVNALDLPIKPYPGETYIRFLFGTKTVTHNYVTQNGKVVRETIDDGVSEKVLDFIYDTAGKPFALIYTNGTAESETYYYVLNLQGDVVKLLDEDGAEVASYRYNTWGKLLSVTDKDGNAITSASHIANLNPIRYRGYYYDTETGFYYLQSRYYDPANHRFINADGYASTGTGFLGFNMFAYCNNDPTNGFDPTGKVVSQIEFGNEALLYGEFESGWETVHIPGQPLGLKELAEAVWDDTCAIALALYNNAELSFGVGQGLYGELNILDSFEVSLGAYGNLASVHLKDGKFRFGQEYCARAAVAFFPLVDFGINRYGYSEKHKILYKDDWNFYSEEEDSFTIFSGGAYLLFLGFSYNIGINVTGFMNDMEEYFSGK